MGFNISQLKNSRFLKKEDVGDGLVVTVKSVTEEDVGLDSVDMKYALNFQEDTKPMILNSTNGESIAEICGGETESAWIGKKIELYHDPNVSFAGKRCGGIRVRPPAAAGAGTETPAVADFADDIDF